MMALFQFPITGGKSRTIGQSYGTKFSDFLDDSLGLECGLDILDMYLACILTQVELNKGLIVYDKHEASSFIVVLIILVYIPYGRSVRDITMLHWRHSAPGVKHLSSAKF